MKRRNLEGLTKKGNKKFRCAAVGLSVKTIFTERVKKKREIFFIRFGPTAKNPN